MGPAMSRLMAMAAGCLLLGSGAVRAQELLFQAEAQTLTGACQGQPVRLEGNHNTLTLSGVCGSLLLKGVANTVRMGIAPGGVIHVEGSQNRVSFRASGVPPAVATFGPDNEVSSGGAALAVPAPSAPAAPRPAVQPVLLASKGPLTLSGDDQERLAQCGGRDVNVSGHRSAYVIRGGCKSLTATGELLTIQAEFAPGARIAVAGTGVVVSWALKGKGRPPEAVVRGAGSRVQHASEIGGEAVR